MDDARTRLVVRLLGAPQVLERGERRNDRTTCPGGVLTVVWSNDSNLVIHPKQEKVVRRE